MPREFVLPGTPERYAPDRICDIQHYRIELDIDVEERHISGRCSLTLTALGQPRQTLILDAIDLDILCVSRAENQLTFTHDGKKLYIHFDELLEPGVLARIDIDYQASPTRGLYFVGPDEHYPDKPSQVWSQGQDEDSRYWFPCFDSPIVKATSEVIATVPEHWYALSNGVLMKDSRDDGQRTMHWRFDVPHCCYLISLTAGDFSEDKEMWNDIEVSYYAERDRRDDCVRTLKRTPEMIQFLSQLLGVRYPYNKYAQVFVADFIFGGMENTTATTLTDAVLIDERASLDHDMERLVVHELMHQWFGDLLSCRDWGEGWLNEGFATYSEYLWLEHSEPNAAGLHLAGYRAAYLAEDGGQYRRTIVSKRFGHPSDVFDRHLYDKAAHIVHMVRRILGDEDFFASVKHYLEKYRSQAVETRDLARAIDEATGRCLDWFFDQWILRGAGHPKLEAGFQWHADRNILSITIRQTQEVDEHSPVFRLPTKIRLVVDGQTQDHAIELREVVEVINISCDSEPEQAIFDPGRHLLCELKSNKAPALWLAQLSDAEEAMDRIDAADPVARLGGVKARATLIRSLQTDEFWGVQQAAADGLGYLRVPMARDALVSCLKGRGNHKVRRAAAGALGSFLRDEQAASALIANIESGDPSYFVEAECCHALGRTRSLRAAGVLRAALDRDSYMDVIRQKIHQGFAALRDPTTLGLLLEASEYGKGLFARRSAMSAMATIAGERRDEHTREVRERLLAYLRDPDYRARAQAIAALETLGDAAACGPMQEHLSGCDDRLRRRLRVAIRRLQAGTSQSTQLAELRDQSELLQKELFELRGRLDLIDNSRAQEQQSRLRASMQGVAPTPQRRKGGKKTIPAG